MSGVSVHDQLAEGCNQNYFTVTMYENISQATVTLVCLHQALGRAFQARIGVEEQEEGQQQPGHPGHRSVSSQSAVGSQQDEENIHGGFIISALKLFLFRL